MHCDTYRQGEKPLHDYLRQHALVRPDKAAFIWYGAVITYEELDRLSDAFASKLASLGVKQGDRVALFMQNCPQYVIAHFGIQKLGAIVGPCGPLFKEHELAYQLVDLGAEVIVAADNLYPIVAAVQGQTALKHCFLTHYGDFLPAQPTLDVPEELRTARQPISGTLDFLDATQGRHEMPPSVVVSMDDVALMTYTSGSTGMPKGAMLSYGNALFKASAAGDCNQLNEDDILLAIAPLYHIAGMLMGINLTIYTGATTVLMYRFDPATALQAIDRYQVSCWYSIATMNVASMQVENAARYSLQSLRLNPVTSFGIILTEALAEQWRKFTGRCHTYEATYGLSETHTWDTYMPLDAVKWGTHGKLVPGVECRILNPENGNEQLSGEMGEIVLRSPGTFKAYWNKPEATAATLRDGWVHTGDMGNLDADGYLTFSGRFKEMIKISGYSVFPEEVETILIRHPAIRQAAVIGVADPVKGQLVKAVVVLKDDAGILTDEALIAWCRANMSTYKVPRIVEFRESLPATGTGKLLRRKLANP
ncbi:AMP-binding protein [Herbaspirillum sp. GCM10030257]|uniref:AMP-binding protein n=1 Tax=Herbaspirillum sp. GCM10030257 TaxID=3273393 RepID=UPI00362069EF